MHDQPPDKGDADMAKRSLPTDATGTLDIEALLAFHRSTFGDTRMEDPPADPPKADPPADPPKVDPPDDKGFPADTPVAEMTPAQQAAYWQHQSRKHEARVKAIGLTPDQIKDLRDKADRHDALERELMSDKDKAVAEAKDTAKAEALATVAPKLVGAEFKAALKGRVPDDQITSRLEAILEPLDVSKFLTDTGDVDTDKVAKFVDGIAPVTDANTTERRGPSPHGQGVRSGSTASGNSVAAGRERYQNRHARTPTTT